MLKKIQHYGLVNSVKLIIGKIRRVYLTRRGVSFSQYGEDIVLDRLTGYKGSGFYVDVGAFDPDFLSNTKKFYERGWVGINIEPNPEKIKRFMHLRPKDINLNLAVSDTARIMVLVKQVGRQSLVSRKLVSQQAAVEKEYKVKVESLNTIFEKHLGGNVPDFLSIDTEGFDLEVLRSNDWTIEEFRPRVICIESLSEDGSGYSKSQEEFLKTVGYKKLYSNGLNTFYIDEQHLDKVKKIYQTIYRDFNKYKADIFWKLGFEFERGKSILDVGAGNCTDAKIFRDLFDMEVLATDIYMHENCKLWNMPFKKLSIFDLKSLKKQFDYVFLHDVLHHIDEEFQSRASHIAALESLKHVCKKGGQIVIVEANRYNPIFYPHMTKMLKHEHFSQNYFIEIVKEVFPSAEFKFFESHSYPKTFLPVFKLYEKLMELIVPRAFLAYNIAIIKNDDIE